MGWAGEQQFGNFTGKALQFFYNSFYIKPLRLLTDR
jgi:hypothetical protein